MNKNPDPLRTNFIMAKVTWGRLPRTLLEGLRELTAKYGFSVPLGDLQLLDGRWYVTHSGLLRLAGRCRCAV